MQILHISLLIYSNNTLCEILRIFTSKTIFRSFIFQFPTSEAVSNKKKTHTHKEKSFKEAQMKLSTVVVPCSKKNVGMEMLINFKLHTDLILDSQCNRSTEW